MYADPDVVQPDLRPFDQEERVGVYLGYMVNGTYVYLSTNRSRREGSYRLHIGDEGVPMRRMTVISAYEGSNPAIAPYAETSELILTTGPGGVVKWGVAVLSPLNLDDFVITENCVAILRKRK